MGLIYIGAGPPGPQGDPGDPGPPGEEGKLAPLAPNFTPNAWTAQYLFRVSADQAYAVHFRGWVVRLDTRKTALFDRRLAIRDDGAGNAVLPFSLAEVAPDGKETGLNGMASATITQQIAPGDPSSVLIEVKGPTGVVCNIQAYTETDDGVDEI